MTAERWPSRGSKPNRSTYPRPSDRKSNKSGDHQDPQRGDSCVEGWSTNVRVHPLRELDHPNLCKFVGGCVEVPDVAIVTEYCPKGSLNDVLLNEDVPLNWGFR